jgi:hypothetical protein
VLLVGVHGALRAGVGLALCKLGVCATDEVAAVAWPAIRALVGCPGRGRRAARSLACRLGRGVRHERQLPAGPSVGSQASEQPSPASRLPPRVAMWRRPSKP